VTVQVDPPADPPHLERRLSLFPATALNRANMLGAGPFITIPLLMSALSDPQSLLVFATTPVRTIAMALGALGLGWPGIGHFKLRGLPIRSIPNPDRAKKTGSRRQADSP
jgi:hypothetical protein